MRFYVSQQKAQKVGYLSTVLTSGKSKTAVKALFCGVYKMIS